MRLSALLLLAALPASAQEQLPKRDTEGLFLDMSKLNLGTISSDEDKKRYLYTIQLEKSRITRKTLTGVYENAFDLYQHGEYDAAKELTSRILAIDPSYEDASILQRAAIELRGSKRPYFSGKKLVDDKFEEGMALYRQGRLVEAAGRWEESVKLSPANLKARYWLKKARGELADDHFRRGQKAYRQHRFREALDQWYAALVLNPRYPKLSATIAKVESEAREQDANDKLQTALNLYGQGQTAESLKMLDQVLESGPGNTKAQKLMAEIRSEMANQHVAQGRQFYETRKYKEAIGEWKQAVTYGYDPRAAEQLTARAKEQMRRDEDARKRAAELAKEREERRKREEAERLAKEKEDKAKQDANAKPKADGTAAAPGTPSPAARDAGICRPAGPAGRGSAAGDRRHRHRGVPQVLAAALPLGRGLLPEGRL
jgi:tetratricopeptide (TPR) repeat protein